jgi:carbon storage regulator
VLVVRRRAGEAIVLGEDIEIEVIEISRTRVKLGIRAPRAISVLRKESVAVAQENQSAARLLSAHPETVEDLLRLLGNLSPDFSSQTTTPGADK